MDSAYFHLVTNHIPIIGFPVAIGILVAGIWKKSEELTWAALVAFILLGLVTIPVYLSGESAEDIVEGVAGISEASMENHEDASKIALASVLVTSAVSVLGFFLLKGWRLFIPGRSEASSSYRAWIGPVVLVLALISTATLTYTASLGGAIRHTEVYGTSSGQGGEKDHDDDDDDDEEGRLRLYRDEGRGAG